ncbi:hypothetical protein [Bacillus sp. CHD6a]|uniref:hypothetical protein n=1 Tax=Bacillus sp. CHD6a TaxID=1643452 RepID=UPI0006CD3C4B|nr:hypothetical protein [Bacillus sp. CHD6a]KPB05716.1 hypothetical protein AAV98_05360 [Bacillus sp. CHD6a]
MFIRHSSSTKGKFFFSISLLFLLIIMQGCSQKETVSLEEYTYGAVYTDMFNKSEVHLYDKDGKFLNKQSTPYKGITMGAFMENSITLNNKVYYTNPLSDNDTNDFILELDKKSMEVKKVANGKKVAPTVWTVDEEFAYMAGGPLEQSDITKTNISSGDPIAHKEIEGQAIHMLDDSDVLYLLTIIHSDPNDIHGIINVLSKEDLSVEDTVKIDNLMFSSGMKLLDNNLYLLKTSDGMDNSSSELIKVNVQDSTVENITLPINNLNDIHIHEKTIYITQGNIRREPSEKKIAKYSLDSNEIEIFSTEIENSVSYIHENKFITSDGNQVQIYTLKDFQKEEDFQWKKSDKYFASFFINNTN